jgi:hypothetical protein
VKGVKNYMTKDDFGSRDVSQWLRKVGDKLGHRVSALLNLDDAALAEFGLLHSRNLDSHTVGLIDARLTDLGITFCEEIRKYHLEAREQPETET